MDNDLPGQTKGGFLGQDPMPKGLGGHWPPRWNKGKVLETRLNAEGPWTAKTINTTSRNVLHYSKINPLHLSSVLRNVVVLPLSHLLKNKILFHPNKQNKT